MSNLARIESFLDNQEEAPPSPRGKVNKPQRSSVNDAFLLNHNSPSLSGWGNNPKKDGPPDASLPSTALDILSVNASQLNEAELTSVLQQAGITHTNKDGSSMSKKQMRKALVNAQKAAKKGDKGKSNMTKEERKAAFLKNKEKNEERKAQAAGTPDGETTKVEENQEKTNKQQQSNKSSKQKSRKTTSHVPIMLQHDDQKRLAKYQKKQIVQRKKVQKEVPLFAHLPQYERETSLSLQTGFSRDEVHHPAIIRTGLRFADGSITGASARCHAMLTAFKEFIKDYRTPPKKELNRDLGAKLKPLVRYLIDCRPLSLSMGSAIRFLKMEIAHIPPQWGEAEAKTYLIDKIDEYLHERILFADQVIADHAVSRIDAGDVIMTYGSSHVVELALKKAKEQGKDFRVIVVDSRPKLEGKKMLKALVGCGIKCTYLLVNALSYVIKETDKVFLGANAMLSNGSLVSRVGTAVVAMMAHRYKVPVLACCETFKFHERVQLESISFNELGDPDDLISVDRDDSRFGDVLRDWRDLKDLKLLNLIYDLTPTQYISMVVTEVGLIPPTSIPVIIREYHQNKQANK